MISLQTVLTFFVQDVFLVNLHSAEEDDLSPFDSKIACLCQSIEINHSIQLVISLQTLLIFLCTASDCVTQYPVLIFIQFESCYPQSF